MKCIEKVRGLPFFDSLQVEKAKVYCVGGAVRDHFLGEESKDLDILIANIELDKLITLLSNFGKVDQVGKSFGIIKFKAKGGEEIDIAIPRKDVKKEGGKHTDFEIIVDPFMSIKEDLARRDFTMNAIAVEIPWFGGIIIHDPFKGQADIKSRLIKSVSDAAFVDDPLRILRAVQFAARFDFTIDTPMIALIRKHKAKLEKISAERVTIELQKMVDKGVANRGLELIIRMDMWTPVFRYDNGYGSHITVEQLKKQPPIDDFAQLIWVATRGAYWQGKHIAEQLKVDSTTTRRLKALQAINVWSPWVARVKLFENLRLYPEMLTSPFFKHTDIHDHYSKLRSGVVNQFNAGLYPKTLKELAVDSFDMMDLGYREQAIGEAFRWVVKQIMRDKLKNSKAEIIAALKKRDGEDPEEEMFDEEEMKEIGDL